MGLPRLGLIENMDKPDKELYRPGHKSGTSHHFALLLFAGWKGGISDPPMLLTRPCQLLWDARSLAVGSNTSWEMAFRTDTEAGFLMLIFLLRFDQGRIGIMRRYVVITVL